MDKPPTWFPSAQRDSTLCGVCSLLNVHQLVRRGESGRGVRLAFGEIFKPLISPRFPIGHFSFEPDHFHRHHPLRRRRLPRLGRPNHKGCAPKLRRQLPAKLPPEQANHEPGQPHHPRGPSRAGSRAWKSLRHFRGLIHGIQVRAQTTTTDLAGLHPHGGALRGQFGTPRGANSLRPRRPGGDS